MVCNSRSSMVKQQSADFEAGQKWLEESLPSLLTLYSPRDVFNADETALFYGGMSTRGFVAAGERPLGIKSAKERLTDLVTANMDGSEKRPLLVIGKSVRPRRFPLSLDALPVLYESPLKAWMKSKIWNKFLLQ